MASANWDKEELTNVDSLDPLYKFDTHFPDRLSRFKVSPGTKSPSPRANKRGRDRNSARFKTQPITFDEIKEIDEDSVDDSKEGLRNQFAAFSRSMDGLVPGLATGAMPHPAARDVRVCAAVTAPITYTVTSQGVNSSPSMSPDSPDGKASSDIIKDEPSDIVARLAGNSALDLGLIHPRRRKKHTKAARRHKTESNEEPSDIITGNDIS